MDEKREVSENNVFFEMENAAGVDGIFMIDIRPPNASGGKATALKLNTAC